MNITLSIDEQIAERAREKLRAMGKSLNQEIRDHLLHIVVTMIWNATWSFSLVLLDWESPNRAGSGTGTSFYEDRLQWPRK